MQEFVDLETAKSAKGVRIVSQGAVPSPWSEAAKGLFRVAGIPVLVTRHNRMDSAQAAWLANANAPVVFHGDDPPRNVWSQILALAVRLAPTAGLLPDDVEQRTATVGMIHELAGEGGVGWNARLVMVHVALQSEGARGFPLPVAKFLAPRYGYTPDQVEPARAHVRAVLEALAHRLRGAEYFGGAAPNALDIYSATFLTPVSAIAPEDCPNFAPPMRPAFAAAHAELGAEVPPALADHRRRMFERHLAWPIAI